MAVVMKLIGMNHQSLSGQERNRKMVEMNMTGRLEIKNQNEPVVRSVLQGLLLQLDFCLP